MKGIIMLFALMLTSVASYASDTLLFEIKPSQTQRGVRFADWKETSRYIKEGMLKYQVIINAKNQEKFAILNEADTALKGKVEIPQYVHSEEDGDLEVRGLGLYAFYLGRVSEVKLPESVEYIGDLAFYRCYGLEKLNIPEKVHTIGNWAFVYSALDSIRFPDNLVNLGGLIYDGAVDNKNHFRRLRYLYLGKNISNIKQNVNRDGLKWYYETYYVLANRFCNLEAIEVSPDNDVYYSVDGVLFRKQDNMFCIYPREKKDLIYRMPDDTRTMFRDGLQSRSAFIFNDYLQILKFSDEMDSIPAEAIWWCESLKTIILPKNLKCISSFIRTFSTGIKSVYAQNPIPSEVSDYVVKYGFESTSGPHDVFKNTILYVPRGSAEAYQVHPVWGTHFKEVKEYDTIDYRLDDFSSCDELVADSDKAVVDGNNVRIVSDDHHAVAYIYDMQGRIVAAGKEREFTLNSKGIFLLKFKNLTKKFIVR